MWHQFTATTRNRSIDFQTFQFLSGILHDRLNIIYERRSSIAVSRFSVHKFGDNNHGSFFFLVNGKQVAYKYLYVPGGTRPNGDATINLELSAGQTVQIENFGSVDIYGTHALWCHVLMVHWSFALCSVTLQWLVTV